MTLAQKIVLLILILMSFAAGAAKVMQMPQEVAFFAKAGLGVGTMVALGVMQILGAALSIPPGLRVAGAVIMGAGFLASAVIIFMTGNLVFASVSLLPVLLTGVIINNARRAG